MAEVSDFDVATPARFLRAENLSTRFHGGGRNERRTAILQFRALGGYRADVPGMSIRVSLNGSSLGQFSVPRWQSHAYIIPHVVMADFVSDRIRPSGSNELVFDPVYADDSDYCWIGPAMVHFRQNS